MAEFKLTIAWDFDGVIHPYTNGWQGPQPADEPPTTAVIETVRWCRNVLGLRNVIFSTRASDQEGLDGIVEWLAAHRVYDLFDEITHVKPPALAYVDDRAVVFNRDLHPEAAASLAAEGILALCRADGRFKDPYSDPLVEFTPCCDEMADARDIKLVEIRGGELTLAGKHPEAAENLLTGITYDPADIIVTMGVKWCPWCGVEVRLAPRETILTPGDYRKAIHGG